MFLRKNTSSKTGRTFLSIVQGYRADGKSKQRTVQKVGYLDVLQKEYPDPVAHFSAVAAEMEQERLATKNLTITLDLDSQIERNAANRKNYGHIVFSKIYHELEIHRFLKNARRHETFAFNTDAIMRLLVYTRLLYPGSKRASILLKENFFDSFKFSLDDIYNALAHFDKISTSLQRHLHEMVTKQYKRETDLIYYDVTNYYFETEHEDELRKKGYSKEHRRSPIVQMGLALDKQGLPISYKLFKGNTHDSQTLMPVLVEIVRDYGAKRVIAVADKGLNSGDNIVFNTALGHGYVFSQSVRGASEELKNYILNEAGYEQIGTDYKRKSRIIPVTIQYSPEPGKKKKVQLDQKQVVFYSEKYAKRAKHKRAEVLRKAADLIANPSKYKRTTAQGAAGYISGLAFDKKTGEVLDTGTALVLNEEKIREEEKMDGYYAIVTSELDEQDDKIIELYRGLWRIEESFKITKFR